jgi:predicted metalloprotease with PDZ domain
VAFTSEKSGNEESTNRSAAGHVQPGVATLIRYTIRMADADRHLFEVECHLSDPDPEQRLTMPSWIPGSYLLREFARYVVAIRASTTGSDGVEQPVPVERIAKGTWACPGAQGGLRVTLSVFARDQSVRGAWLDRRRAYFNGPCVFPYFAGRETAPVELTIEPPSGESGADWRVATALAPAATDARGFGRYRAADYDELIDHPVEIGNFERIDFTAAGVPHRLVVTGRIDTDLERVATDLAQLCEAQIAFFGGPPPFGEYWFLGLAVGDGYGGLEHRASSSLIFSRDDLPKPGEPGVPHDYQRFLGLVSHEYFHSWHVKRTKPAAFVPYQLDRRNHTRLLWVFEGVTSYYQDLFLLRCGLIGAESYLQRLGETLTRVYRTPGRLRQSVADASFDAWDRLYKPESNSVNAGISYYSKGALIALALDLRLRRLTANRISLDTVVVELWSRFGLRGLGVPEDGFEQLVLEIAGAEHAEVLTEFFAGAVRGTDDLPLAGLLGDFGVDFGLRPAMGPEDRGGTVQVDSDALTLGAAYRARDGGIELVSVLDGGVAQVAGLAPGDLLVAIDGLRVSQRKLRKRLARLKSGERVPAHAFRGDELLAFELGLADAPHDTVYLELSADASAQARILREDWLGV